MSLLTSLPWIGSFSYLFGTSSIMDRNRYSSFRIGTHSPYYSELGHTVLRFICLTLHMITLHLAANWDTQSSFNIGTHSPYSILGHTVLIQNQLIPWCCLDVSTTVCLVLVISRDKICCTPSYQYQCKSCCSCTSTSLFSCCFFRWPLKLIRLVLCT
jgi:hypothetical protein